MKRANQKLKICGITTRALTLKSFMVQPLKYFSDNGFESYAICHQDNTIDISAISPVHYIPVEMKAGRVSPIEILKVTWTLFKIFRKYRFDIVQYASSNAGLYASIAAWLARVPVRVFCQWGVIYIEYTGFKRLFYKTIEKLTCLLSTSVQPDSPSNLDFAIQEGLYKRRKGEVIYNGSATGVDLKKYNRNKRIEWRDKVLTELKVPNDSYVFGFVGRLCPEKGINELLEAFLSLSFKTKSVYLILVGPTELPNRLRQDLYNTALNHPNIRFTGQVSDASFYYASFDMLVLPSYREGFGMVLLEAAAMGTPSIISDIKGPTDLIKNGFNGYVCKVKSAQSLIEKMYEALCVNSQQKAEMERNAYEEAASKYNCEDFYMHLLSNRLALIQQQ